MESSALLSTARLDNTISSSRQVRSVCCVRLSTRCIAPIGWSKALVVGKFITVTDDQFVTSFNEYTTSDVWINVYGQEVKW